MDRLQIEQKLLPRLKAIGIILIFFSLITIAYSFISFDFVEQEIEAEEEILTAFGQPPPLNPYFVATIFGLVGISCMIIVWRKKNAFKASDSDRG